MCSNTQLRKVLLLRVKIHKDQSLGHISRKVTKSADGIPENEGYLEWTVEEGEDKYQLSSAMNNCDRG